MNASLIDRYKAYRTRRFLAYERRWSTLLPEWRTQRRRRLLVGALLAVFVLVAAAAVLTAAGLRVGPPLYVACLAALPLWAALQIVSGRQADAPADTLDEWEAEQRNAARSIGLTLTQSLAMIPAAYLIFAGGFTDLPSMQTAYAGGLMLVTALLVGGCAPTMILAWNHPDPDPEDTP